MIGERVIDVTLPLVPGLPDRLRQGIDVADVGCGSGHAVNLMAEAFPGSRFVGFPTPPVRARHPGGGAVDGGVASGQPRTHMAG